jgi:hypothetical protein
MDELARKAVVTPELRAQVPALVSWFTSLSTNNVPSASTGIVVGGAIAKSVSVFDNELSGVAEAVHVGVSAGGAKVAGAQRQAGRVEIRGNRAAMSIPFELELGARAFFVGNVGHAVIADNDMRLDTSLGKRSAGALYREGIRVWGMFGPSVRIDDNLLAGCLTGVRVQPRSAPPTRSRWSVSGNVAPNAHAAVAAPANVVRSENVP